MADLRAWARERCVGEKYRDERDNLASGILHGLHWRYRVQVVEVSVDQWMAIHASSWAPIDISFYIQCDQFEDGLALLYKRCFERWGEERPWPQEELES